jgi:glycosyltransferase involved in cell wall biosynthesis
MGSEVRVLGLDVEGLENFRTETKRNSGLYRAVDQRLQIIGTFTPRLPLWQTRLIQLLHFAPDRDRWRRRAGLSPMTFRRTTNIVEKELRAREDTFDVILQIYCLFAPGRLDAGRRYAMYLDATAALTRREFPAAVPVGRRAHQQWLEMERQIYHGASRLFPMSQWVRTSLIEDYGVDPSRILVAGAGSNVVHDVLPERHWNQRVALFVGFDWQRKGGPVLLQAWRQVKRALPDAQLWIVGTRRAYGPHGVDGVRWFGRIDHAQVAELYLQASVFVLPALFDPFPHALREALGQGLPCISTATGATSEILQDGVDGVLVPPSDPHALAVELVALLGDPDRAESMGRTGHDRMRTEVTWSNVADIIAPELEAIGRE